MVLLWLRCGVNLWLQCCSLNSRRSQTLVCDWFVFVGYNKFASGKKRNNRGEFLKRLIAGMLIVAAVMAIGSSFNYPSATAQPTDFQLTVRNITGRQPLSPPLVIVHESNAVLLPSTADRLDGLEEFAESGAHEVLMESLSRRSGVKSVSRFGGTISPQQQFTLLRVSAEPGDHISVMGSLECTNDGIAMGTLIVP